MTKIEYDAQVFSVKMSTETIHYPATKCAERGRLVNICCSQCGEQFTARLRRGRIRKYCSHECYHAATRRFSTSAEELLQRLTETPNYTTLGKELGVSANAIKKRCRALGISDKADKLIADAKVERGKDHLEQIHTAESRRNNITSRRNNLADFVGYDATFDGLKEVCRFRSREDLEAAGYNYEVVCRVCRGMYNTYKKLVWRREKKTK